MTRKKYVCPVPECGREAVFVKFEVEEVWVEPGTEVKHGDKPPMLQRCALVRCSVHGEKYDLRPGHHVTAIPKKRATEKKADAGDPTPMPMAKRSQTTDPTLPHGRVSLAPLSVDEALEALLKTPPPPKDETPKKAG
jgi:hypothetical protein